MMLLPYMHSTLARALDTMTVRVATRLLALGILFIVLVGSVVQGSEPAAGHAVDAKNSEDAVIHTLNTDADINTGETSKPGVAAEIDPQAAMREERERVLAKVAIEPVDPARKVAFFAESGRRLWGAGNHDGAERSFAAALNVNAPVAVKRDLLLELAALYEDAAKPLQVIAILEKFRQSLPDDPATSKVLLRLGIAYRETGALAPAIARFFQVLNSTLRLNPDDLQSYRGLAMKARLEIAETYALQGDSNEARKYYERLEVLELDEADRERVLFRGAQLSQSLDQWPVAERQLAGFIEKYPESGFTPEARYLRAKALEKMDRKADALDEVIALLRSSEVPSAAQIGVAGYWKRRTGNEIANKFYEEGDILGALSIYQALARASDEPSWRWPAVYQIGLCFERLALFERAAEAYRVITSDGTQSAPEAGRSDSLDALQSMAKWRLEHLDWVEEFGNRMQMLSSDRSVDT